MLEQFTSVPFGEEIRNRIPNENDVQTILDLHSQGWKAPAIASGIEMNIKAVRNVIRKS